MNKMHTVTFKRNRITGQHLADCSCGWFHMSQSLAECQLRASTHDTEWETFDPTPTIETEAAL